MILNVTEILLIWQNNSCLYVILPKTARSLYHRMFTHAWIRGTWIVDRYKHSREFALRWINRAINDSHRENRSSDESEDSVCSLCPRCTVNLTSRICMYIFMSQRSSMFVGVSQTSIDASWVVKRENFSSRSSRRRCFTLKNIRARRVSRAVFVVFMNWKSSVTGREWRFEESCKSN